MTTGERPKRWWGDTQRPPLERIGFPSELGVDQCFDGTDVVDYEHD